MSRVRHRDRLRCLPLPEVSDLLLLQVPEEGSAQRPQFQCVHQTCECHDKLLCGGCVVDVPNMGQRTRKELVSSGRNGFYFDLEECWLFFVIGGGVVVWLANDYTKLTFLQCLGLGVITALTAIAFVFWLSFGSESTYRDVTEWGELGRSKCRIACRQAAQTLED